MNDTTQQQQVVTGAGIKAKAQAAIEKGRRESLEGKLKNLLTKRAEAERTLSQIDEEIEIEIANFEKGK